MTSDLLSLHARFVVDVITNAENTKRSDNIKDNISPYNLPIQASTFLPRNAYRICQRISHMHCADCRRKLSVCLSHAGIECKQLYISSKIFHHPVAPPF